MVAKDAAVGASVCLAVGLGCAEGVTNLFDIGYGDFDEPLLDGIADQFGTIVDVNLAHEVVLVDVNRLYAEIEPGSDFLDSHAFGEKFQDFSFAPGQTVITGLRPF